MAHRLDKLPVGDGDQGRGNGQAELVSGAVAGVIVCLLYTSDAADDQLGVDLGGRRIIKKKRGNPVPLRASSRC